MAEVELPMSEYDEAVDLIRDLHELGGAGYQVRKAAEVARLA